MTRACADDALPRRYAIVLGENDGGAGQGTLKFAEDDARKMRDLRVDLGDYRKADVTLAARASGAAVERALADVAAEVAADSAAGRPGRGAPARSPRPSAWRSSGRSCRPLESWRCRRRA